MEEKLKIYKEIKECKDVIYLGDLYRKYSSYDDRFEGFQYCVRIKNRILELYNPKNSIAKNYILSLNTLFMVLHLHINEIIAYQKYGPDKDGVDETNNKFYLGFNFFCYKLNNDYESKKNVAERMILDIFVGNAKMYQRDFNVEEDLHKKYRSIDEIKKQGINNLIISIIYSYDPYLADFISSDISILDNVKYIINNIINNFNKYEKENEKRRYKYIIEDVRNYCNKFDIDSEKYLFLLSEEYGITDRIIDASFEYNTKDKNIIKKYISSIDCKNDFNYIKIQRIFKDLLDKKIIAERDSYLEETDEEYIEKICKELYNYDMEKIKQGTLKEEFLEKININARYAESIKKLDYFSKCMDKYKNEKHAKSMLKLSKKRDL